MKANQREGQIFYIDLTLQLYVKIFKSKLEKND